MKIYSQKWYSDKLGTCTTTIKASGCFISCLSMLAEIEPPEVNKLLTKNGGYSNGCMLLSEKAAEILGLEYKGKVVKDPKTLCVAETNYYKNRGFPQHFFIYNQGDMVDPLDNNPEWRGCSYPIVSYRLFSNKNNMSEMYKVDSKLRNAIEKITGKDYKKMDTEKLQEKAGEDLEKEVNLIKLSGKVCEDVGEELEKITKLNRQLIIDQDKINEAHDLELERVIKSLTEEYNTLLDELQSKNEKFKNQYYTWGEILNLIIKKLI